MHARPSRFVLPVLLSILLGVGPTAVPAQADTGELRTTLPVVPALVQVRAASGNDLAGTTDFEGTLLSHDGGETWQTGAGFGSPADFGLRAVKDGLVAEVDDYGGELRLISLADGQVKATYDPAGDFEIQDATTTAALIKDWRDDAAAVHTLSPSADRTLPGQVGDQDVDWQRLLPDGSVVGVAGDEIWALSPQGNPTLVTDVGESFWLSRGTGDLIVYTPDSGDPCVFTANGSKVGCSRYLNGEDYSSAQTQAGFLAQDRESERDLVWLPLSDGKLQAGRPVELGNDVLDADLAALVEDGLLITTLTGSGSYVERFDPVTLTTQRIATDVTQIGGGIPVALTPTAVLLQDSTHANQTWKRSVGGSISEPTELTSVVGSRSSALASAARWVVPSGESEVVLYDRGSRTETVSGVDATRALSGPYLLAERGEDRQLRTPDGNWTAAPNALSVFGGLVLEDLTDYDADEPVAKLKVRDLSGAGSPAVEFTLPSDDAYGTLLWGDTVAYERDAGCPESDAAVVYDFRAGKQVFSTCGDLLALGDGLVVVMNDDTVSAYNLSGTRTTLVDYAGAGAGPNGWGSLAVDGDRVAYTTESDLVIKTIPGAATSAPRSLGVTAPASYDGTGTWSPQIDLTKPVAAGKLVITDSTGKVVRELAVGASADGSVRGVGWDGKDGSGNPVPKGIYSIGLTNQATDGSGAVVRADGTAGTLATVSVEGLALAAVTPSISGTARTDQTLTAVVGSWGPAPVVLSYQWLRDGAAISGATAQTYRVTATDVGRKLSVRVTGSKTGYPSVSKTSAAVTATAASLTATPLPSVSGTAAIGKVLTAGVGTWAPVPVTLAYQWRRDGAAIAGATRSTYTVQLADANTALTVTVTGSKTGYASVARTSKATATVPGHTLTATPTPVVSGTAKVGSKLTAKPGTWKPSGVTLGYQWYRGGKAIVGATKSTYTVVAADKGTKMSVKVTGSKIGYTAVTTTSKATAKVVAGTLTAATPKISGAAKVGSTLTVKPGTWKPAPVTFTYQWLRAGKVIKGATKSSYKLVKADKGTKVSVKVTGTKPGYTTASKASKATSKVT
ncbi:MAG: FlgD immunoglobulin-like domain containing protein [Propionicimonas sp.]|nr:FlgD immunoglobulin-like domain containing protein [Propionicimonas sp.]